MSHIILYSGKPIKLPECDLLPEQDADKATLFPDSAKAYQACIDNGLAKGSCRVVTLAKFKEENEA